MPIDLDAHATTACDPRVVEAMLPYFTTRHGNASSDHERGLAARAALKAARADVARLVGCPAEELVFVSGATEGNNLALVGSILARGGKGHVVTTAVEHSSVLGSLPVLRGMGAEVTVVPVGRDGLVDPGAVVRALRPDTVLVSVMAANNEVGTLQPVGEIVRACRARKVPVHCDAAQALGKVPLPDPLPDLVTVSAHKLYGPLGIGALRVARGTPIRPTVVGGTHEGGLRAGTPNLPGAVGFGVACSIAASEGPADASRMAGLRDQLLDLLIAGLTTKVVHVNGSLSRRLPGNLHITLMGVCTSGLDKAVRQLVTVSSASACRSGAGRSHVLDAMAAPSFLDGAPLRFGLSRWTTEEEIVQAAEIIVNAARPLWGKGCEIHPGAHGG